MNEELNKSGIENNFNSASTKKEWKTPEINLLNSANNLIMYSVHYPTESGPITTGIFPR